MARPKQSDLEGMTGPGVSKPVIKELDRLGDKFIDIRDEKAELASDLGKVEEKMATIMEENGLTRYQFSDQEIVLKKGKVHVKIKTVKVEGKKQEENGE